MYFFDDFSYDKELDNFSFNKLYYRLLDIKEQKLLIKAKDIIDKCNLVGNIFNWLFIW